jgi:hypothetical protein
MSAKKRNYWVVFACLLGLFMHAQQNSYDEKALLVLDRMSQVISGLNSCAFKLRTSTDRVYKGVTQTEINNNEVHMASPDKLMVDVNGDKGHRSYYYNGKTLSYYSFDENNYARIDVPRTVLETFDTLSASYGIEFPAADFFYPDFTDDLMANSEQIDFEGRKVIDGKDCFHIVASGRQMNVQIWVSNDAMMLPKKMIINYYGGKLVKRYEGDFSDWSVNAVLPAPMFEFVVPPGAKLVYMMPNNDRPIK